MEKFCFILLSLCSLSGCTGSPFHPYKNTDGLFEVDIQIDGAATPYYAPSYLAQEKGYFKEEGLQVNFCYASTAEIVKNVGAENVSSSFLNAGTVLLSRRSDVPVNIIHTAYRRGLGAIIYKSESGIHKMQDLRSRAIVITGYNNPNYIQLKVILQQNDLPIHDVQIRAIGTDAIVNALVSNQADTICLSELRTHELQSSGIDVKQFLSSNYTPSYGNVVVTSQTFLKEHPEICRGSTDALNRDVRGVIEGQVQETVNIAKEKFIPSIAGSGQKYIDIISQEFVKNLWVSEDTAVYGYGYNSLHDYQIYIDLLQRNGLFETSFPADELIVQPGGTS